MRGIAGAGSNYVGETLYRLLHFRRGRSSVPAPDLFREPGELRFLESSEIANDVSRNGFRFDLSALDRLRPLQSPARPAGEHGLRDGPHFVREAVVERDHLRADSGIVISLQGRQAGLAERVVRRIAEGFEERRHTDRLFDLAENLDVFESLLRVSVFVPDGFQGRLQ